MIDTVLETRDGMKVYVEIAELPTDNILVIGIPERDEEYTFVSKEYHALLDFLIKAVAIDATPEVE